jgi:DNA-binding SARP family transcriptional activator
MIFYNKLATGDTYRLMGDLARAREWIDSAAQSVETSASSIDRGQLKLAQGLLARDQGQLATAVGLIGEARALFSHAEDKHFEALTEYNLAHLLNLLGRTEECAAHLIHTVEIIKILGYDHFLVVEGRRTVLTLRFASGLPEVGQLFKRILARVSPLPQYAVAPVSSVQAGPTLAVYSLGQEDFTVNGKRVCQLRPQVRELFLFLLTRYPLGARKDELAELLWHDLSAERADGALRITITRIRKALCPVSFSNGWYALASDHLWYDVQEFERGLADAKRATGTPARISRLQQALELHRGDYLPRLEADWVLTERQRLRTAYLDALLSLAQAYTEAGDLNSALSTFQRVTNAEPFLEAAWAGLMQTYLRQGNRMAAKASYEKLKQILHTEMGIEPSPEIQALYQRLINMSV